LSRVVDRDFPVGKADRESFLVFLFQPHGVPALSPPEAADIVLSQLTPDLVQLADRFAVVQHRAHFRCLIISKYVRALRKFIRKNLDWFSWLCGVDLPV
jgi:hypothetical protein